MQTDLNFELLSRTDSMAAMTVRTFDTYEENRKGSIHSKMKGKRAKKLEGTNTC